MVLVGLLNVAKFLYFARFLKEPPCCVLPGCSRMSQLSDDALMEGSQAWPRHYTYRQDLTCRLLVFGPSSCDSDPGHGAFLGGTRCATLECSYHTPPPRRRCAQRSAPSMSIFAQDHGTGANYPRRTSEEARGAKRRGNPHNPAFCLLPCSHRAACVFSQP